MKLDFGQIEFWIKNKPKTDFWVFSFSVSLLGNTGHLL